MKHELEIATDITILLANVRENESDYMNGRQIPQKKQTGEKKTQKKLSNRVGELKQCATVSMAFQSP